MKKLRERITNKKFIASFISVSILSLLFLAGPVQAFLLGLDVDNTTPNKGENITFTATLDIEKMDKYLPVKNLSLILNGPEYSECIFDINGNNLSECKGIVSIERISVHSENEFGYGYGYGYDSDNGYGYDFGYDYGYDYGYGYNYGYGGKPIKFEYKIILDTTDYSTGTYDTVLKVLIGNEIFSKNGVQITINAPSTIQEEDEEKEIKTSSRKTSTFYYNLLNTTSNQVSQGNSNGEENKTIQLTEGDEIPGDNQNFLSLITGAVIGTLGTTGTVVTGFFIVALLGGFGIISYKRRKSK
ncbi:hypothetical protein KAR91_39300 [Candidatus Pacearchaeota archaeon]|nr:hypothetical protein [Candidatus Pacearchaeota archaeon]